MSEADAPTGIRLAPAQRLAWLRLIRSENVGPVTFRALTYGLDFGPEGNAYAEMIRDLPAMRDWYEAGLAETWRDTPHDEELSGYATVTQDLRAG